MAKERIPRLLFLALQSRLIVAHPQLTKQTLADKCRAGEAGGRVAGRGGEGELV